MLANLKSFFGWDDCIDDDDYSDNHFDNYLFINQFRDAILSKDFQNVKKILIQNSVKRWKIRSTWDKRIQGILKILKKHKKNQESLVKLTVYFILNQESNHLDTRDTRDPSAWTSYCFDSVVSNYFSVPLDWITQNYNIGDRLIKHHINIDSHIQCINNGIDISLVWNCIQQKNIQHLTPNDKVKFERRLLNHIKKYKNKLKNTFESTKIIPELIDIIIPYISEYL
jgi:hypothetical protein